MAKAPLSIAAASTLAMVRMARSRGFETADLLSQAGLSLEFLEDPDSRIPGPTVFGLWSALRERTGDPALQLAAPSTLPFGAYKVIDYLVASSQTVGEGVQRFARFFGLIADAISLDVLEADGERRLRLQRDDGGPVPPFYVDYIFAAFVSRTRMWTHKELRVKRVELRQAQPASVDPYAQIFRAPVVFGAAADLLCFADAEWDAPSTTADAALARLMEEHARILAERIPHVPVGFQAEVQQAIASAPATGGSAVDVARALRVSVRTLQRKLVETGTTFREVSDTVRGRLAEGYLNDPKVSIAEVAFLLGFSDQSSFNRAFRRWTGDSPGRWRRRMRLPT